MDAAKPNRLSDGRPMRVMENPATQVQLFDLCRRFNPQVEGIAKVKDVDDALIVSKIYKAVMGDRKVRTDEYSVYHRDPTAELGKEIFWVEGRVRYKMVIPDVPVKFDGKEISLQHVVGMGIYPSIDLLKIEATGENEVTVSPISLDAIAGKVRAMNFMRSGWAFPDEYGFPDGSKPSTTFIVAARYGWARTDFDKGATGCHGSVVRGIMDTDNGWGRGVYAGVKWSSAIGVALVGSPENPQAETGK